MAILIKQKRHCRSLKFRVLGQDLQGEEYGENVLISIDDARLERALIRQHNFKRAKIEVVKADGSKVEPEAKKESVSDQESQEIAPEKKPRRRRRKKTEE